MRTIWIIARRELESFFDSLMPYILIVAFLGFSGFFTWLAASNVFYNGEASMRVFMGISYWTLFFFIPTLTMRLIAEEKKTGTIELLLTKAVTDRQVVVGKFIACLVLVLIALLCTAPYFFTITSLGDADVGGTISGYLALVLMSAAYIGIGLFASSVTNNQIVAILLSLVIGVMFHFLFGTLAASSSGVIGEVLQFLSLQQHWESMARGVLDLRDVVYFFSVAALGLGLAELSLTRRRL